MVFDGIDRRTKKTISLDKKNREITADLVEEIVEEYVEQSEKKNKQGWSLESLHISPTLLYQILAVAFTIGSSIVTTYNMLDDRLNALENQAALTKATTEDKLATVSDLQHEIDRLKAQEAIFSEMINAIQIKMTSQRK